MKKLSRPMMKHRQITRKPAPSRESGFTLIEIAVSLGILLILATMAVPSLLNGVIRNQIKESLALADIATRGVSTVYAGTGEMPADNIAAHIPEAKKIISNLISAITIDNGAVTLTYGNNASSNLRGKHLTLRPAVVADTPQVPIAWVCATKKVPDGMTVKGQDLTDIKPAWLPIECRQL